MSTPTPVGETYALVVDPFMMLDTRFDQIAIANLRGQFCALPRCDYLLKLHNDQFTELYQDTSHIASITTYSISNPWVAIPSPHNNLEYYSNRKSFQIQSRRLRDSNGHLIPGLKPVLTNLGIINARAPKDAVERMLRYKPKSPWQPISRLVIVDPWLSVGDRESLCAFAAGFARSMTLIPNIHILR